MLKRAGSLIAWPIAATVAKSYSAASCFTNHAGKLLVKLMRWIGSETAAKSGQPAFKAACKTPVTNLRIPALPRHLAISIASLVAAKAGTRSK